MKEGLFNSPNGSGDELAVVRYGRFCFDWPGLWITGWGLVMRLHLWDELGSHPCDNRALDE